jgi:signal transduction histidine kinase
MAAGILYAHIAREAQPMEKIATLDSPRRPHSWNLDRLFDAASKETVIRLRWPLVILSSYLLYYTPSEWLTPTQIQALLALYLLSHSTLYFLADDLFDSPYFYAPLLIFDTVVLLAVFSTSGTATPDFYVACLFTIVVSCICNDARGLLITTILAPLGYAYFVFHSAADLDPQVYLRLPFPFVISLFYGYFAQVARMRRTARSKDEQVRLQQKAATEIRRQRERLEVLHEVNRSVTSTIDKTQILESFLDSALIHLPYAAACVRVRNSANQKLETAAARGLKVSALEHAKELVRLIDAVAQSGATLTIRNVFSDAQIKHREFFENEGLVSLVALPLAANGEMLGCSVWLTRNEHDFNQEEVDFLSTLVGQAAGAVQHSELYDQSRRQTDELRSAHQVKDEFLKVISTQLKTPLNVITGYSDMFLQGVLGEMTPIQEKAIETIGRQSKELHRLINTVLQLSNVEAEKLHVELHEFSLWEFFSELRSFYDGGVAKEVQLVWSYPADLPSVTCDRAKLSRILENLIDNAIKFTERGTIGIVARYLQREKMLQVKVLDTGEGIPQEQIPKIFERFQQLSGGGATLHGGVGLGLYLVKKYVDVLGGQIQVNSRMGESSSFTLLIPAPLDTRTAPHQPILLATASAPSGADAH